MSKIKRDIILLQCGLPVSDKFLAYFKFIVHTSLLHCPESATFRVLQFTETKILQRLHDFSLNSIRPLLLFN